MPLKTKAEKKHFVRELIANVKAEMLAKIDRMPEEWDGVEIRQLMLDHVRLNVAYAVMTPQRKRDYENERLVRNL